MRRTIVAGGYVSLETPKLRNLETTDREKGLFRQIYHWKEFGTCLDRYSFGEEG